MIILPEAVRSIDELCTYAGVETQIVGKTTSSEGDALFNFQMHGVLREMLLTKETAPFWNFVHSLPPLPGNAIFANFGGHHDEIYLGMISEAKRPLVASMIERAGGQVYKNGMSAGARMASILNADEHHAAQQQGAHSSAVAQQTQALADRRMALSLFTLYMLPGTPVMYYGDEIGATNQPEHAQRAQQSQFEIFQQQGLQVSLQSAFDPRELQRGPITAAQLHERKSGPSFQMFASLNRLREAEPSLQASSITDLANGNPDVLSLVRFSPDFSHPPLVAFGNLASQPRTLRVPLDELREKVRLDDGHGLAFTDLLTQQAVAPRREGDEVVFTLEPYQSMLLKSTALNAPSQR